MTPPFKLPAHLRVVEPTAGGRTVKAEDLLRKRPVSLKWAASRREAQALRQEWNLLSRLSTRFVPEPIDLVQLQDHTLLTAGWIFGVPLNLFLPTACPSDQVAAVADALAGLDHLHRAGLCHRDIRAHNLLVTAGPKGPQSVWLDLEHAVTAQSFDSGAFYVAGKPPGADRGGEVFNPQHDIESFCGLLSEILPLVPAGDAANVLTLFAARAANVFYQDEMPHARAAWTILRELLEAAHLQVPTTCSPLGHPAYVENSAALRFWRAYLAEWERFADRRALVVQGKTGMGKRRFLAHQAALLAASGIAVTNLFGVSHPDWSCLSHHGEKRVFLLESQSALDRDAMQSILTQTAELLLLIVEDTGDLPTAPAWQAMGITQTLWKFTGFGARDWYRWTQASV